MGTVLLLRHGQASFGGPDYDVLSEIGHAQARLVGARLAALPRLDRVVHGSLVRQRDTAASASTAFAQAPPVTVDARFDEYDQDALFGAGAWSADEQAEIERRLATTDDPRQVFQEQLEVALRRWTEGTHGTGESYTAFRDRTRAALADVAGDLGRGEVAVVVTSGGVIAALVADAWDLDAAAWIRMNRVVVNASLTTFVTGRRGTSLLTVNDHAHLEGAPPELRTYR